MSIGVICVATQKAERVQLWTCTVKYFNCSDYQGRDLETDALAASTNRSIASFQCLA
jgi:hypothetical protein